MYPLSPLAALAKAYPSLTSASRLQAYTRSRLPADLLSRGDLAQMPSGSGRIPFSLGEDLVVKTARMPRGIQENTMEGDWVAPVPEAVWKSDDGTVAVVRRALPADAKLKRDVKKLQPVLSQHEMTNLRRKGANPDWLRTPEGQEFMAEAIANQGKVEAGLEDLDWSSLLDYDPLWGDIAPRNVGLKPSATREPLLLDAGILDRRIMDPRATREAVSPQDWMSYRSDVLRAKKEGGLVQYAKSGGQ